MEGLNPFAVRWEVNHYATIMEIRDRLRHHGTGDPGPIGDTPDAVARWFLCRLHGNAVAIRSDKLAIEAARHETAHYKQEAEKCRANEEMHKKAFEASDRRLKIFADSVDSLNKRLGAMKEVIAKYADQLSDARREIELLRKSVNDQLVNE